MPDDTKPRCGFALCVSLRFPLAIPVAALVVCFSVIVGHIGGPAWKRTTGACFHHHRTKNVFASPAEWRATAARRHSRAAMCRSLVIIEKTEFRRFAS